MILLATFTENQVPKDTSYPVWVYTMFRATQRTLFDSPNEERLLQYGYLYCIVHARWGSLGITRYWRIYHMDAESVDYRSVAVIPLPAVITLENIKWYRLNKLFKKYKWSELWT